MKIEYDGKTVNLPDELLAEIHVENFRGPLGGHGFRSGIWPFTFRGKTYNVEMSVPHTLDLNEQDDRVRKSAAIELLRAGVLSA